METFERLVHGFYSQVKEDNVIGPLYPDNDWEGAEQRLTWFLAQYWGGPQLFSENRGHPRLRMRHGPFPIGPLERDAWLRCMDVAIASIDASNRAGPTWSITRSAPRPPVASLTAAGTSSARWSMQWS